MAFVFLLSAQLFSCRSSTEFYFDDKYGTASFFFVFLVSSSFSIDRNVARQEQICVAVAVS